MEQRMNYITLGVNDLQTMTRFYEQQFGWQKAEESNENISFFKLNGVILGLFGRAALADDAGVNAEGSGFKSFTLAYNTRSEAEVGELIAELEAKGVTIVKRPEKVFWGGYSSYIADPEGNLWEIAFNPFLAIK